MLTSLLNSIKKFETDFLKFLDSDELLNTITELKKDELSKGKRGDGNDITPNYDDVPGFKFWYKDWKKKNISSYKLDGTPDLYIDGTFYSSLYTKMDKLGIYTTDSDYSLAFMADVVEMHKGNGTLLDLTSENIEKVSNDIENFVLDSFNF